MARGSGEVGFGIKSKWTSLAYEVRLLFSFYPNCPVVGIRMIDSNKKYEISFYAQYRVKV